ncbi:MAG TPA: hypothetical protein VHQ65_15620 [Thermoanaerobaculia bacterium]|nr:hypothetical protein [Thermoanaerobaculia bacterium]
MKKYFTTLACSALLAAGAAFAFTALPADAAPTCPNGKGVHYVSRDVNQCAAITFVCNDGYEMFFNECGCGCIAN